MDLIYNHNYQKSNTQFRYVTMVLNFFREKNKITQEYPVLHLTARTQIIIFCQKKNVF